MTKKQRAMINDRLMEISNKLEAIYEETMSNEELDKDREEELNKEYIRYTWELEGIRFTMWRLGHIVTSNIATNGKYQII